MSELHPDVDHDEMQERLKSYTVLGTNRTAEDYGLFDDLLDRDSFEQQLLSVGHTAITPRMSSHRTSNVPVPVPGSSPPHLMPTSSIASRRRSSVLGEERLSVPLRGLLHSSSWIKDEEDRWAIRDMARKERVSRGGDGGV